VGTSPGTTGSFSLIPTLEYNHPCNALPRCVQDTIDIGAYEYCMSSNIPEYNSSDDISLYPNPSYGKIHIALKNYSSLQFTLCNLYGEKVFEQALILKISSPDLTALPAGCYFYFITGENEKASSGKIVVVN
jgi:hypothetical protein